MDMSAVLAYKSLFLANRTRGAVEQASEGKGCTATANAARVAVTASQSIVPLFAVSDCIARTAGNKTLQGAASTLANSKLKNIAGVIATKTTTNALPAMPQTVKVLSKLGVAANIAYAAAKCMDASEENKTEVLLTATGNCAGMYLFEKLYSLAVKKLEPKTLSNGVNCVSNIISTKIPFLKSIKLSSVLLGIGFVAISLLGCKFGEIVGKFIYDSSTEAKKKKLIAENFNSGNKNNNVNLNA